MFCVAQINDADFDRSNESTCMKNDIDRAKRPTAVLISHVQTDGHLQSNIVCRQRLREAVTNAEDLSSNKLC